MTFVSFYSSHYNESIFYTIKFYRLFDFTFIYINSFRSLIQNYRYRQLTEESQLVLVYMNTINMPDRILYKCGYTSTYVYIYNK
jgi:hypothetical protein